MTEEVLTEEVQDIVLDSIEDHYNHLKLLVDAIELDTQKANKGNKAAGVRLRKSLRHLKGFLGDFVKFTLNKD